MYEVEVKHTSSSSLLVGPDLKKPPQEGSIQEENSVVSDAYVYLLLATLSYDRF